MLGKNDLLPANNVQCSWRDGSWCISKLMNVFASCMHTYATQGLCKHCGAFAISVAETLKTVYQSLLAQLGQKIVMEEKRMGSECEKKKKNTGRGTQWFLAKASSAVECLTMCVCFGYRVSMRVCMHHSALAYKSVVIYNAVRSGLKVTVHNHCHHNK